MTCQVRSSRWKLIHYENVLNDHEVFDFKMFVSCLSLPIKGDTSPFVFKTCNRYLKWHAGQAFDEKMTKLTYVCSYNMLATNSDLQILAKKPLRSSSVRAVWDKLALEASGTSEMQPQAAAKEPRAAQGTIAICGKGWNVFQRFPWERL